MFVTGLVLAAGASRRLGQPKQLLPFHGGTLLDATLSMARRCGFDQLIVAVGGAADEVRELVDLRGADVVDADDFSSGCGSSIRSAMGSVEERASGVVLLLGDQPGVRPETVERLLAGADESAIGVCRYTDGLGHPFWLGREVFPELRQLHGDKAVWKLLHSGRWPVTEVAVDAAVPADVDSWDDYRTLVGPAGSRPGEQPRVGRATGGSAS